MATTKTRKPKPDNRSVVAKPSRGQGAPSLRAIRSAEIQAENGDLRGAVSICNWLLADDRVAGALDTRGDLLFGLVPTFEPTGDKRRSNRAVRALEAEEDYFTAYPEAELRLFHKWGLLLGAAPGRHYWTESEDHGGRVLAMPEFWTPDTLRFDFPRQLWTIRDSKDVEHLLIPGDSTWMLHLPFGKGRPWTYGLWRSLARWARIKAIGREDAGYIADRSTLIVGTAPELSLFEERNKLANDIIESEADAAIVLQHGYDLKRLDIGAGVGPFFKTLVDLADQALVIRIRGGNLTTNVEGGSKAATETQFKGGDLPKLRFDAEALSTTVHDQSLVWWAEFNFGDRKLAPWPVYPTKPPEDVKAKAETSDKAMDAATKADKLGFQIDAKKFSETFGIEWLGDRKEPEPVPEPLEGNPAPPPAGAKGKDKAEQKRPSAQMVNLAKGLLAKGSSGFVDGQLYADGVVDSADETAAKGILGEWHEDILAVIDGATDYDDLRARLKALYADADPDQFVGLVARAMKMADLAGRHAVNEDA
jgi:hypothetical protein